MKKTFLVLALICLCLGIAYAREYRKGFQIDCTSEEEIMSIISKYEEIPIFTGLSSRPQENGKLVDNQVIMFLNPTTKTWTLLEKDSNGVCAIVLGSNFKPFKTNNL